MNEPSNTSQKPQLWLLVSLALNFLLIGVLVGRLTAWPPHPPPKDRSMGRPGVAFSLPQIGRIADQLSDETRQAFRTHMDDNRPEFRRLRKEMRAIRRQTFEALTSEPFDQKAFEAAIARQQEVQMQSQELAQTAMVAFMSGLSAEQRAEFVAALTEDNERREERRERYRDHRKGPDETRSDGSKSESK